MPLTYEIPWKTALSEILEDLVFLNENHSILTKEERDTNFEKFE